MRGGSLLGGLAFAVVAALGAIPWLMVTGLFLGHGDATALYCLGLLILYVITIATGWPRALSTGALAAVLAAVLGALAPSSALVLAGAAVALAVLRSGFLYRSRPLRGLLIEGLLAGGGLAFAGLLAGSSLLGTALAIWGFFLVQSLFFLAGGVAERSDDGPAADPFDRAREQALALIEDPGL